MEPRETQNPKSPASYALACIEFWEASMVLPTGLSQNQCPTSCFPRLMCKVDEEHLPAPEYHRWGS